MGGKNTEGYYDPTATEAVGRVFKEQKELLRKMCQECMHRAYCGSAYKKDTWCGNHVERGGSRR